MKFEKKCILQNSNVHLSRKNVNYFDVYLKTNRIEPLTIKYYVRARIYFNSILSTNLFTKRSNVTKKKKLFPTIKMFESMKINVAVSTRILLS